MGYKAGEHRIYMNVGFELTEEPIREYFGQFGKIVDVYLPRNKRTNNVMGYGFATFEAKEHVDKALEKEEHLIKGQTVKINRAGPRPNYEDRDAVAFSGPHGTGPRLYVGGVPQQLCEEDIRDHFCQWGQVVDIYFPPQKNGRRSSYCFVRFSSYAEARRSYTESQRRIKGLDIEAINMAKDRLSNNEHGSPHELSQPNLNQFPVGPAPPLPVMDMAGAPLANPNIPQLQIPANLNTPPLPLPGITPGINPNLQMAGMLSPGLPNPMIKLDDGVENAIGGPLNGLAVNGGAAVPGGLNQLGQFVSPDLGQGMYGGAGHVGRVSGYGNGAVSDVMIAGYGAQSVGLDMTQAGNWLGHAKRPIGRIERFGRGTRGNSTAYQQVYGGGYGPQRVHAAAAAAQRGFHPY